MLFSRVKISCLRAKAHQAFHWCLYNKMFSYIKGKQKQGSAKKKMNK